MVWANQLEPQGVGSCREGQVSLGHQWLDPRQGSPTQWASLRDPTEVQCDEGTSLLPSTPASTSPGPACCPPARAALHASPAPALPRESPTHLPGAMGPSADDHTDLPQASTSPAQQCRAQSLAELLRTGPARTRAQETRLLGPSPTGPRQCSQQGFHMILSAASTPLPPTVHRFGVFPAAGPLGLQRSSSDGQV